MPIFGRGVPKCGNSHPSHLPGVQRCSDNGGRWRRRDGRCVRLIRQWMFCPDIGTQPSHGTDSSPIRNLPGRTNSCHRDGCGQWIDIDTGTKTESAAYYLLRHRRIDKRCPVKRMFTHRHGNWRKRHQRRRNRNVASIGIPIFRQTRKRTYSKRREPAIHCIH